jgi:hypothetical protein
MHIRPAEVTDLDWLLEQMKAFHEFVGTKYSVFPPAEQARALVRDFIEKHVAFVTEYNLGAVAPPIRTGFTIAILHPHLFNPSITVLTELFWWVTPQYRGTRAGALLLQELERVGHEQADWVVISLERHSPVKHETLERRGFKLWETTFLREQ